MDIFFFTVKDVICYIIVPMSRGNETIALRGFAEIRIYCSYLNILLHLLIYYVGCVNYTHDHISQVNVLMS